MNIRFYPSISYLQGLEAQAEAYASFQGWGLIGFTTRTPTITLGRRAHFANEVRQTDGWLNQNQVEVLKTERGGLATLHSPGQLVIFPVFTLNSQRGPKWIINALLRATEQYALRQDIKVVRNSEPGIYTEKGKLAFIGLRIQSKKVFHGLSLNVSNDLDQFKWISSCGEPLARHDRLQDYGVADIERVFFEWCEEFKYEMSQFESLNSI